LGARWSAARALVLVVVLAAVTRVRACDRERGYAIGRTHTVRETYRSKLAMRPPMRLKAPKRSAYRPKHHNGVRRPGDQARSHCLTHSPTRNDSRKVAEETHTASNREPDGRWRNTTRRDTVPRCNRCRRARSRSSDTALLESVGELEQTTLRVGAGEERHADARAGRMRRRVFLSDGADDLGVGQLADRHRKLRIASVGRQAGLLLKSARESSLTHLADRDECLHLFA